MRLVSACCQSKYSGQFFFFLSYLFYYYKCIVTIIITINLQYFHLNFIDLNLTVTVVVQKHMLKNVIYLTFLIENDLK